MGITLQAFQRRWSSRQVACHPAYGSLALSHPLYSKLNWPQFSEGPFDSVDLAICCDWYTGRKCNS